MNERMNERLVNHSSRKFKVARYDTHVYIVLCVIKSTRCVRSFSILLLRTLEKGRSPRRV